MSWIVLPFILQSLLMAIDEFYFHLRRGLGAWERWGHPMDTLSVLVLYGFVLFLPLNSVTGFVFWGCALFSQLLVTKDEWVHTKECVGAENWLHALLFGLHPWLFAALFVIWNSRSAGNWELGFFLDVSNLEGFVEVMAVLTLGMFFYQLIYWNGWRSWNKNIG